MMLAKIARRQKFQNVCAPPDDDLDVDGIFLNKSAFVIFSNLQTTKASDKLRSRTLLPLDVLVLVTILRKKCFFCSDFEGLFYKKIYLMINSLIVDEISSNILDQNIYLDHIF